MDRPRPRTAELLDLAPHPEGGWYRETWRAGPSWQPAGYPGPRPAATGIYFLLAPGDESAWHRVRSDEVWLWHSGGPLVMLDGGDGDRPADTPLVVTLGQDLVGGEVPQHVIPAGHWQAARPASDSEVLVSCVVAPGFDFADFTLLPGCPPPSHVAAGGALAFAASGNTARAGGNSPVVSATEDRQPVRPEETAAMTTEESASPAPDLLLGPILRYVGETEATVWVETGRGCQVEILGRRAGTFEVAGHHYGLVVIEGLAPGSEQEYQVALDGVVRWPQPADASGGFPPSVLRTLSAGRPVRIAFGSCRVAEIAPANLDRDARRRRADGGGPAGSEGTDALAATAAVLAAGDRDRWPDVLLMIGDQVYADEPGPATRQFIAEQRARQPAKETSAAAPADEVADFAEYCALYREAWSDPAVRWLFSVVPTAMIFDDHDVHDDWNTSGSWRRDITKLPWWHQRIESAFQSYWVYQHLGNLSPADLAADETWGKVSQPGDAAPVLADLAHRADQRAPGVRWSVRRTFAGDRVRVVLLDSRSRRVVDRAPRLMTDEGEWGWLAESVSGDWEHVVIATSVPPLLPRGIHSLEAWTERICSGAWGQRAARFGERLRRTVDLEHWPAFGASFTGLEQLLTGLAAGRYSAGGQPPATVTLISGDIHHSFLAAVELPAASGPDLAARPAAAVSPSAVYEAVCSPFHQAMAPKLRYAQRLASTRLGGLIGAAVASVAGASVPGIKWRVTEGPWFTNMIATLEYDGRAARIRFDRALTGDSGQPLLDTSAEARLS